MRFVFVGERPSRRAEEIGATWQNGKLAAKTLREALISLGIDPNAHLYFNLWQGAERSTTDREHCEVICSDLQALQRAGYVLVAMGQIVSKELTRRKITHLQLIHPAARGTIRKTERYQAHVAQVLKSN